MNRTSNRMLGALIVIAGCQTMATDNDVPARITSPTDASRTALQSVVNDALNTAVLLADDALTTSSSLSVERNPPKGLRGQLATGRNMDPPIRFQLVLNESDCILIDTRDESRHVLENTICAAE